MTRTVSGTLGYLSPTTTVIRRFVTPDAAMSTSRYDPYPVTVRNARDEPVSLATHGFELVRHASAFHDFSDKERVEFGLSP